VFERFSDAARRTVVPAQEQARLLRHDYIGTEHLLLGLLDEDDAAARILREMEVHPAEVRQRVRSDGATQPPMRLVADRQVRGARDRERVHRTQKPTRRHSVTLLEDGAQPNGRVHPRQHHQPATSAVAPRAAIVGGQQRHDPVDTSVGERTGDRQAGNGAAGRSTSRPDSDRASSRLASAAGSSPAPECPTTTGRFTCSSWPATNSAWSSATQSGRSAGSCTSTASLPRCESAPVRRWEPFADCAVPRMSRNGS
jgi:hypothetical protein